MEKMNKVVPENKIEEEPSEEQIDEFCQIIISQTTYTLAEAREKLEEFNYDYIKVIKQFMGITEKKDTKIKSVNQEIYKQMRQKLHPAPKVYQPI